jgi:putative effector of murein hydrolase
VPSERPLSALPSPLARALAYVSIVIGGIAGALIGYALVDIQYDGSAEWPLGLGILIGAVAAAAGTAVVAILVLRAVGEWRSIDDR